MACLLKNEPASCSVWLGEVPQARCRSESESEEGEDVPQGRSGGTEQTRNRVSYPWPG
jgi:hypothetical protein